MWLPHTKLPYGTSDTHTCNKYDSMKNTGAISLKIWNTIVWTMGLNVK